MIFTFITERRSDLPVVACCRAMKVSTSGSTNANRVADPCGRARHDADLTATIVELHRQSRGTYGAPRVHAELRLGALIHIGRKRVARLMRQAGLTGVYRRRRRHCTQRDRTATASDDLVNRRFTVDPPDQLWVSDITEHATASGKVHLAVVIDAFVRRVIGHSIADHLRAELVVDALQMSIWRRNHPDGTIVHSDHGTQYTCWAFGSRLRAAGLLGSMGSVGDAYDNALAESFFGTLQLELLDRHNWAAPRRARSRVFEWTRACFSLPRGVVVSDSAGLRSSKSCAFAFALAPTTGEPDMASRSAIEAESLQRYSHFPRTNMTRITGHLYVTYRRPLRASANGDRVRSRTLERPVVLARLRIVTQARQGRRE
jgi:putative transposase